MSETESTGDHGLGEGVQRVSTEEPAVGLVARTDNGPAVAAAILRAQGHGHQAIVAAEAGTELEGLTFARQLGAIVIELDEDGSQGRDPQEWFGKAARQRGFPGLLFQMDPETHIDFEASLNKLHESPDYAVNVQEKASHRRIPSEVAASSSENIPRLSDENQLSQPVNISTSERDDVSALDGSIVAIIPTYNEAESIADIITETRKYVEKVLVVDDGSSDSTVEIAHECADGVITHHENMGVGAAVHTGYLAAIREGFDYVLQIDGDGQHDPAYIPELLRTASEDNASMVIGSRWLNGSYKDYSRLRRAGIKFFTFEANIIGGLDISDVTSGFRLYDVSMLEDLGRPENSHWALEQTLEAARKGYRIAEVSVPMPPENEGSQFDIATFVRYPPRMLMITLKILLFR